MPVTSTITPEVWGIVERVSQLTKDMSPQNLKSSKLTEQPIVYSILTGTRVQIESFFKKNEKTGKYANHCVSGPYEIIDLDMEVSALHDVIRGAYLNEEKSNFYLRKEYIFASENAREYVEDPQYLPKDIENIRELLTTKQPKVEPTLRAMVNGFSTPPPRQSVEPSIEPSVRATAKLTCGHPTKAGTPCKRGVKAEGAKCATHRDGPPADGSPDATQAPPVGKCGQPTKAGTPCQRNIWSIGDKCSHHCVAPDGTKLTCGHPTKAGTPCKRGVKAEGAKCATHRDA